MNFLYCPSKWLLSLHWRQYYFPWDHINSLTVKDYGLANGWNIMPYFSIKFTWLPLVSMLPHISWPFKSSFLLNYLFSSFTHCVLHVFHDNLTKFMLPSYQCSACNVLHYCLSVMHSICNYSLCLFKDIQWRAKIILCWVHNDCRFFCPIILLCWTEVALILSEERWNKMKNWREFNGLW